MLGYMTANEAKSLGMTHHGKYFGIPVWIGGVDDHQSGPLVCTKWAPMEYVMSAAHHIEALLRSVMFPDCEPTFQFWVGRPI